MVEVQETRKFGEKGSLSTTVVSVTWSGKEQPVHSQR